MKKYKLLGDIMLSFISETGHGEQFDTMIGKIESEKFGAYLESDGTTVWYIIPDKARYESITTANIIDYAIKSGKIEEISE